MPKSSEDGLPDVIKTNYDGERYLDLGKKKRVTVRSFKGGLFVIRLVLYTINSLPGAALVDIREFYGQEGDEKPGKKGIALSPEQVNADLLSLTYY